jgi:hypothetical protein
MNFKRTTTIGVVGALIAWFAGAATSKYTIPPAAVVQQTSIEKRGAALSIEIDRLHERLAPTVAPRSPSRNLFAFRVAARPAPAATPAVDMPPRPALTEARPAVSLPPLKLSGIAEDPGPDGPLRTAIIAGDGQLFMVKEGEQVTARYRVAKISADVVELTDVIDNSVRRLALR